MFASKLLGLALVVFPLAAGCAAPLEPEGETEVTTSSSALGASAGRTSYRGLGTAGVQEVRYVYGVEVSSHGQSGPAPGVAFLEPVVMCTVEPTFSKRPPVERCFVDPDRFTGGFDVSAGAIGFDAVRRGNILDLTITYSTMGSVSARATFDGTQLSISVVGTTRVGVLGCETVKTVTASVAMTRE